MKQQRFVFGWGLALFALVCGMPLPSGAAQTPRTRSAPRPTASSVGHPTARLQKRWLFVWRDMSDPKEVDRLIERLPRAQAEGYNGVVFAANVPESRAAALRQAARAHGIDLVAVVMGNSPDRNYTEGVLSRDAQFVAQNGIAVFQPQNPPLVNGDFEETQGNHIAGWAFQDDEGVTTFVDHDVTHSGKASLRMENVGKSPAQHCRIAQPLTLIPHRQYRISFWLKTQNLAPADPEVKVLTADSARSISFETFHTERTQEWTHYDLVFNSLENSKAMLYLGTWDGKDGAMWWDDLKVEEIALVNVLRRPGTPVTVRGENGTVYTEGQDYVRIVDPLLHPYIPYHEPPRVQLTPTTRIHDGERLYISYYHPLIIYEDRLTSCLSEPKIFADWRAQIKRADRLLHPAAFLMSHDELRVVNQCALCQSRHLTPGQLLADNVHRAAQIIRSLRPDAEIWVWSDMFDPLHNAVDQFYAVDGTLKGSWKGLDPGIGIMNWGGHLKGKNSPFFARLGLRQILSGYYDGDEDGKAITQWLANTRTVPGIVGVMYTTWEDKYAAMDVWLQKARSSEPAAKQPQRLRRPGASRQQKMQPKKERTRAHEEGAANGIRGQETGDA